MQLKFINKSLLAAVAVVLLFACDAWRDDVRLLNSDIDKNLYEIVRANNDISTFAAILQQTGYDRFLQEEQSLTVFAPTNEALKNLNLKNEEELKGWVKNYIAYLSHYANQSGVLENGYIEMINGKNIPVNANGISGSHIVKANLLSANGVLHIIDNLIADRKNIWEYLKEQTEYGQTDFIRLQDKKMMDEEKSVQTGVDMNGRPLYDTVWVTRNAFLETYPLNDEKASFTFILLENTALETLKTKYAKYFAQKDSEAQNEEVLRQITSDLVLKQQPILQPGRFLSQEDILVDIDPANITESYQASNGRVYKLRAADIKMYENKIKTQIIEAEDYFSRWDAADAWEIRYRSWASGGKDVILKGTTRNTVEYDSYNEETGVIESKTKTFTYNITYRTNDPLVSKSTNAYLKFEPTMYSTDYEIYWVAYDDVEKHYSNFSDTLQKPMLLEQKLLISFPGEPALVRNSDGQIVNNFSPYSVMAGVSTAGIHEETQLVRYRVNTTTAATLGMYVLEQPYLSEDSFGNSKQLKSPAYGKASFFVANTVRELNANAGLVFLDYIRLKPLVDPND